LSRALALAVPLLVLGAFAREVARYDFLSDDCFIAFRYARNLAEGQGLVWNAGERVEGYTNFLWVLSLAGGIRAGAAPETLSRALGVASGLLVLLVAAWLSAQHRSWRDPWIWAAPAALALNRSFAAWSSGGLETQAFTLWVLAGYALLAREHARGGAAWSAPVLAVATLTRPEGALFFGIAAAFRLADVRLGRLAPRRLALWAALYVLPVAAHLLWRHGYYGAWLPNTFYAKVPGLHWSRGLEYLALFQRDYQAVWLLALGVALAARRRRFVELLFATAVAAFGVYVAAIGGDRFDFRMLVPILPQLYWLAVESLLAAAASVRPKQLGAAGAVVMIGGLLLVTRRGSRGDESAAGRGPIESVQETAGYARGRIEQGLFLRSLVERGLLPPDLRIAVSGAGAVPYYTRFYTVDRLGLNDATIARLPVPRRGLPGHEREAAWSHLVAKRVALNDAFNRIVFGGDAERLPAHVKQSGLPNLRCLQAEGRTLLFTTTLDDRHFERTFHALARCP
jgi:hypothetical protein